MPLMGSLPLTPKNSRASEGLMPCLTFSRDGVSLVLAWDWGWLQNGNKTE